MGPPNRPAPKGATHPTASTAQSLRGTNGAGPWLRGTESHTWSLTTFPQLTPSMDTDDGRAEPRSIPHAAALLEQRAWQARAEPPPWSLTHAPRPGANSLSLAVRHALDAVSEAVLVLDLHTIVVFANDQAERTFGVARGTLWGTPFAKLLSRPQRAQQVSSLFQFANLRGAGPEPVCTRVAAQKESGEEFTAELSLRSIAGEAGDRSLIMATVSPVALGSQQPEPQRTTKLELGMAASNDPETAPSPLTEHRIGALLDGHGRIVSVNDAWRKFGQDNGASAETIAGVGLDYLAVCDIPREPSVLFVLRGIQDVLSGAKRSFSQIYRCHSPEQARWYRVEVTPREGEGAGAVVVHVMYH